MPDDHIPLDETARIRGLHPVTLPTEDGACWPAGAALLRDGVRPRPGRGEDMGDGRGDSERRQNSFVLGLPIRSIGGLAPPAL